MYLAVGERRIGLTASRRATENVDHVDGVKAGSLGEATQGSVGALAVMEGSGTGA